MKYIKFDLRNYFLNGVMFMLLLKSHSIEVLKNCQKNVQQQKSEAVLWQQGQLVQTNYVINLASVMAVALLLLVLHVPSTLTDLSLFQKIHFL